MNNINIYKKTMNEISSTPLRRSFFSNYNEDFQGILQ